MLNYYYLFVSIYLLNMIYGFYIENMTKRMNNIVAHYSHEEISKVNYTDINENKDLKILKQGLQKIIDKQNNVTNRHLNLHKQI